jgi:hypothetical protein
MSYISLAAAIIQLQWEWNHRKEFPAPPPPPPPSSPHLVLSDGESTTIGVGSLYGTDGVTWTNNAISGLKNIAYNASIPLYLGYGPGSIMYHSTDGITWTNVGTSPGTPSRGYWNGSLWVVIDFSSNAIYTSPNGIAWTARVNPLVNWVGEDIIWSVGLNLWIAVGQSVLSPGQSLLTSPDGITWTHVPAPGVLPWEGLRGCGEFAGTTFVCGFLSPATGSGFWTSANGVVWTNTFNNGSLQVPMRPANGTTAVVTMRQQTRNIYRSLDGINWVAQTLTIPTMAGGSTGLAYFSGQFVMTYSPSGEIYKSTDEGVSWSIVTTLATTTPWKMLR